jgi:hypothetical protein
MASAQPSSYHSGKGYAPSKGFRNSKMSGKASVSLSIQQRAEKSARAKRSTKSVVHGLNDSDNSDSEYVRTPSISRLHTRNMNRKGFSCGSIQFTTPQSNGLEERDRSRTKSQLSVIAFSLILVHSIASSTCSFFLSKMQENRASLY